MADSLNVSNTKMVFGYIEANSSVAPPVSKSTHQYSIVMRLKHRDIDSLAAQHVKMAFQGAIIIIGNFPTIEVNTIGANETRFSSRFGQRMGNHPGCSGFTIGACHSYDGHTGIGING